MKKLILISDLHHLLEKPVGRLDKTKVTQARKVDFVFNYANENQCPILQAGDWSDTARSWILLPEYIDLLNKWKVPVFTIYGQHDTYLYSESTRDRTSLDILGKTGFVHILSAEPFVKGEVNIYGCSYGAEVPQVKDRSKFNILVIHKEISVAKIWAGQREFTMAEDFLKKNRAYNLILCGDIHKKFIVQDEGRIICNTGCLIRKSVDLWEHKPGFYVYDLEKKEIEWVEIPHELPEKVMSKEHLIREEEKKKLRENFISSVGEYEVDIELSFKDNLEIFLKEQKIETGVTNKLSILMEGKNKK